MRRRDFLRAAGAGVALAACRPLAGRPVIAAQGVVTAIDRANRQVRAVLTDGQPIVAAYMNGRGRMPWPLATATFERQGGWWLCTGPIGDRREILNDDFTQVPTVVATVGGALVACDTPWIAVSATPASTVSASTRSDQQGAANVAYTANAAGAQIVMRKGALAVSVPTTGALWLSARILLNTLGGVAGVNGIWVGLSDLAVIDANSDCAMVGLIWAATSNWYFATGSGSGTLAQTVSGVPAVADEWAWVDIVVAGGFSAAWVNGDGPYVSNDPALIPSGPFTPFFRTESSDILSRQGHVDALTLTGVGEANDPSAYRVG